MKSTLQRIQPSMQEIRRQIHANAELAFRENATAALITKTLEKFGYTNIQTIAGTGVMTVLDSGMPGKTVALRADMDALPLQELTQLPYQSKNAGIMHACGHDGHTTTLLAAAAVLMENKHAFKGKIKFIFQPAEEIGAGAVAMIKEGVLENPNVDAIFGYHNTFRSDPGKVIIKQGCLMAGQDAFTIVVKGKGGHAAHLATIVDPIYIGSLIVQAIQGIVSRLTSPTETVVISVTQFHGGTTYNVMPDEVILNGTIRTITLSTQKKVRDQITEIASGIAATYHATADIAFDKNFPPTINHPRETELVARIAKTVIGADNIIEMPEPSMACEDFSHYLEKIPGCFFFIGNGDHGAIHSAKYQFNDDIIPIAAEMLAQVAIGYLNSR